MADEPSIDEILASLDQLLKEGESRNDEPEEAVLPPAGEPSSPSPHDAPTPHFFEVLDDEVEAAHADVGSHETDDGGNVGQAEPEAPPQGDDTPGAETGAHGSRLYVLTDAMMVDEQPSLPLGMGDAPRADAAEDAEEAMRQALAMPESTEDAVEAGFEIHAQAESGAGDDEQPGYGADEAEPAEAYASQPGDTAVWEYGEEELGAEPEMHGEPEAAPASESDEEGMDAVAAPESGWDEADVQALVDQITDDVCSAMAEQLPEMIRVALAERLAAFVDERTKNQHTGNQE